MKRELYLSAILIPLFYFAVGIIFILFPEIPQGDIENSAAKNNMALWFTQEIGVLFLVIAILIVQIYKKSSKLYASLRGTMILIMLMLASIEPYLYYKTGASQLLVIFAINLFFILLLILEKQKREE